MFPGDSLASQEAENVFLSAGAVLVTGPMSSGTRWLAEIVSASGVDVVHDGWHATIPRPADRVIVIVRDPVATRQSRDRAFVDAERIPREASLAGCVTFYRDALWLTYEQLCAAPEATVAVIAAWLGRDPWPLPSEVRHSENSFFQGMLAWP